MGRVGDVGMVLVVGALGLYLLYAYNTGQLEQFGFAPSGDTTINNTYEDSGDGSGSCSDTNTMGCCTDNAGNTCWRGTTTNGVKTGGCIAGGGDCDSSRDKFIKQFGEETRTEKLSNLDFKGVQKAVKGTCDAYGGSCTGECDKSKSGFRQTECNSCLTACGQQSKTPAPKTTSKTRDPADIGQYSGNTSPVNYIPAGQYTYRSNLGSAFNRRGPSYNYRDDFIDKKHIEFPDRDWYGEASKHPFYLGDVSLERDMLLKRFNSMRVSIA